MAQTQKSDGTRSGPGQEEMAAQIGQIKQDIGTLTKMMADYAGETEQWAEAALRQRAQAAREQGAVALKDAQLQAQKLGAQANEFVAHKPGMALGIAAGLGFLVGVWGARR
jgi:ElaB/YqjD/DUF883 family membrane-anchored ribosome-binding protein